jgi:hypothetical protein
MRGDREAEPDIPAIGGAWNLLMHGPDVAASKEQLSAGDHGEMAVREHPAWNRAVVLLPASGFLDQVLVAQDPLIRRRAHGHRTNVSEKAAEPAFLGRTRGLDPLAARGPHLELHIRWMQEIRRFEPSTVSRRFSATAGFCRTCAIDGLLEHSPAEYVRRQRGAGCRLCHQPVGRLHNLNI